jgi:DNA-binding NarL/FixJ family response regulator
VLPGPPGLFRPLFAAHPGCLLKSSLRVLLETIRNVHLGRRHLQPEVANEIAVHAVDEALTDREARVLQLIATGRSNKQVAWELGVSEETVKAHLKDIFEKLDVADRTHAVTVAAKRGIIDL